MLSNQVPVSQDHPDGSNQTATPRMRSTTPKARSHDGKKPIPSVLDPVAVEYRAGDTVWYHDANRTMFKAERAATVVSVNRERGTVMVSFFKDPTALREEVVEIVSPRVLRPREIPR